MFQCLCRALTDSGEVVVFTPADVPVRLYSKYFALTRRPNSPLLRVDTLTRALDESGVGEGDTIEWQGRVWTVLYECGFVLMSDDGIKVPAQMCRHYTLVHTNPSTDVRITCKFENWNFALLNFCGHIEGLALAAGCPKYIDPERVQVSTGCKCQKAQVFFGETLDGGEVILQAGRICIKKADGVYDLATKLYLGE